MRKAAVLFVLLVTLILSSTASAQHGDPRSSDPLIVTDEQGRYPLGLHMDILEDPSGKLTIDDVTAPEFGSRFEASQVAVPNFGFTDSAYWVRLPIRNESTLTERWLLELGFANLHYVDLYSPLADGEGFAVKQTGTLRPADSRDLREPHIVFDLTIPRQEEETYYLRFQNGAAMALSLILQTPEAFLMYSQWMRMAAGIFFGALLVLLAYNLFLLFSLRELSYFYLVLFLASMIAFEVSYTGYASAYLIQDSAALFLYWFAISFSLMFVFVILFADAFLELALRLPRLHWLSIGMVAIWALLLSLLPFVTLHRFTILASSGALLSTAAVLAIGVIAWLDGVPNTRFFLVAWIGLLVTFSITMLDRAGIFPSTPLNDEIYHLGILWMGIFWSLALVDRVNRLKEDVQHSERRLSQILEGLPIGVIVYETDTKASYFNRRVVEILSSPAKGSFPDLGAERTLAQTADYFSFRLAGTEELYPMAEMPIYRALQGESASADNIEVDLQDKRIPLEIWASPVTDSDERVESAVVAFQDISRRRTTEAELADYRQHLENLVERRTAELSETNAMLNSKIAEHASLAEVQVKLIEWLSFISQAHQMLNGSEDLPKAYENLLATIGDLLGAKSAFMGTWDYNSDQIDVLCWLGRNDSPWEVMRFSTFIDRDSPISKEIGQSDFLLLPADRTDHRLVKLERCLEDPAIRSVALAPVQTNGVVTGLFGLGLPKTVADFADQQTTLVERVALDMAGFAYQAHLLDQARALVTAEERNRLARDLHDSVTQVLFSASLVGEVLPRIWRRDPEAAMESLEELRRLTRGALSEMRTMLLELRPQSVLKTPLSELLAQLTEAITGRTELPFQIFVEQIPLLPEEVQISFYRIAQEALNNVVKHAEASKVEVNLSTIQLRTSSAAAASSDNKSQYGVKLLIVDDGIGFSPEHREAEHMGLAIMHERSDAIGADLRIDSRPGDGTQITLVWTG